MFRLHYKLHYKHISVYFANKGGIFCSKLFAVVFYVVFWNNC